MKFKDIAICFLLIIPSITSCIQDEALNTEADIESVSLPGDVLVRFVELDVITDANNGKIHPIVLYVKKVQISPVLHRNLL